MRNHTLNMFAISNIAELNFSYKLVQFELPSYDGSQENHNKQLARGGWPLRRILFLGNQWPFCDCE